MTTLTARGVLTGAAMLQLIAEHAGLAPRDFSTGAWLDKLDPALDITARDMVTGTYLRKLSGAGDSSTPSALMVGLGALEQPKDGIYQVFVDDPNSPVDPAYASATEYSDLFGAQSAIKNLNQAEARLQIMISNGTPDRTNLAFNIGIGGSSFTNAPDQAPSAQISWANNQWSTLLGFQNTAINSNQVINGLRPLQSGDVFEFVISDLSISVTCAAIGYTHTLSNPSPRNGLLERTAQVLVFDFASPNNVSDIPLKVVLNHFGEYVSPSPID